MEKRENNKMSIESETKKGTAIAVPLSFLTLFGFDDYSSLAGVILAKTISYPSLP